MLTGERVTLRPVREEDLPVLYSWRIDLSTWAATTAVPPYGMTYELFVERAHATASDAEKGVDLVAEVDGTVVGRALLFHFEQYARHCEIGITIAPGERGKGYGQECLRLLVDFAFRHRNMHRVHLQTLATNAAAIRCYEAVGFVHEGVEREGAWVEREYVDMVRMSILENEWPA
jgi:RimJ/RimL family protein N-acetyltransferase